ncbi:hypothetical protein GCM10011349_15370 [Novosphingobium indicum]|uniref:Uncharacterized protein n=1 Tax=Novosphingobium indicum TaxID=462949 RepID=A0ABQ2JJN9_9SPHN|nr:hypothetical protein GCM10011349_15370 [Novosphingobium indicum]
MIGQCFQPPIEQSLAKTLAMSARVVAHIAGAALRHGAFIEERGVFRHRMHKQLPFPRGQRK